MICLDFSAHMFFFLLFQGVVFLRPQSRSLLSTGVHRALDIVRGACACGRKREALRQPRRRGYQSETGRGGNPPPKKSAGFSHNGLGAQPEAVLGHFFLGSPRRPGSFRPDESETGRACEKEIPRLFSKWLRLPSVIPGHMSLFFQAAIFCEICVLHKKLYFLSL